MGFFDFIGNAVNTSAKAVQNAATSFKETFLPSADVAAQRRFQTFGTTNPVVAGAAIVGGAAVALVGGAAVAGSAAARAVVTTVGSGIAKASGQIASTVGKAFVSAPIPTTASVFIGVPTVAGILSSKPELITKVPGAAFDFGKSVADFVDKKPLASTIIGGAAVAGTALLVAKGTGLLDGNDNKKDEKPIGDELPKDNKKEKIDKPKDSLPPAKNNDSLPKDKKEAPPVAPPVPLTPAVQVLGKSVSTTKRRKRTSRNTNSNQSGVRVTVNNAIGNRYSRIEKYIN